MFAVVALFGVRLVAVTVALIRSDLPASNRLFIGWFGPRGIGTLVLGLLVVERGEIEQEPLITQVVAVTVTLSLVRAQPHGVAGHPVAGGKTRNRLGVG